MIFRKLQSRPIAVAAIVSLAVSGLFGLGAPAYAVLADTPTIIFDGNVLSITLPSTETASREPVGALTLSTASLTRVATTNRAGYVFGGWSLTAGGPATNVITTTTSGDTSRSLYAVWNTTVNYNTNGADSGTPSGNQLIEVYRFGQALTLPTTGTMAKSGFAFGGWMASSRSTARFISFSAAPNAAGNQTLYAAWIKTVTFNSNSATIGTIPASQVLVAGGAALKLPVASEMTLRKTGYEFMGWATTATGRVISNPASYTPLVSQQTLYAIWRIQSTKATARVFFKPGKSGLRAAQKLVIRDLVENLRGKTAIKISLAATYSRGAARSLGKSRNIAVVNYLRTLGVVATFERTNRVGKGNLSTAKKNNRVTLKSTWTNPAS